MKKSWFMRSINLLLLILCSYSIFFITLHFLTPEMGDLEITISSLSSRPDARTVTITIPPYLKRYYLLVYEDRAEADWQYSSTYSSKPDDHILNLFLPNQKKSYLFLEGTKNKSQFSFMLTSKYPIQTTATRDHVFHVEYIMPVEIFPFPTFYFSKHYTFFVDPLI